MTWIWDWESPKDIAKFVVHTLYPGTWLLPENAAELRSLSPYALAEVLYERLLDERISYDREPPSLAGQQIREPFLVLRGQRGQMVANCVDLSVLYAGLCIAAHLRPLVVLCQSAGDARHALVLLTPYPAEQGPLFLWGDRPGESGSFDPTWREIKQSVQDVRDGQWPPGRRKLLPVELTALTDTPRAPRGDFREACARGFELLESADDIQVIDVFRLLQRRVVKAEEAMSLYTRAEDNPQFVHPEVLAYAREHLGIDPPLDLKSLREYRMGLPPLGAENFTLYAFTDELIKALEAKPVFEAVGGTRPGAERLQGIYSRAVGARPGTWVDEMMLVRAAGADAGEPSSPSSLAKFLLAIAGENRRDPGEPPLDRWLRRERIQDEDLAGLLRRFRPSTPADRVTHWVVVHLGDEDYLEPSPDAERQVRVHVMPPIGEMETLSRRCPDENAIEGTLTELFNELLDLVRLGDNFVVDIVTSRRLLDRRYETCKVIKRNGLRQSLHPNHRPRLRWVGHYEDYLRGVQADREESHDPVLEPLAVPGKAAENEEDLVTWLDTAEAKARSVLLALPAETPHDPLETILAAGQGRILWYPGRSRLTAEEIEAIERNWRAAAGDRENLPERLIKGVNVPKRPVVIWNDLQGRAGHALPGGRPSLPDGGGWR